MLLKMKVWGCNRVKIFLVVTLLGSLSIVASGAGGEKWTKKGPNVRILHENDGSRTVFRQSPDALTLVKTNVSTAGKTRLLTVYRMNAYGDPIHCVIKDARGKELFKVAYGYHKESRRLVAEDMFDAQMKRYFPGSDKEMPVRRIYYKYDAHGSRSKGVAFVLKAGKLAEDVFREDHSTYPHQNPFKN